MKNSVFRILILLSFIPFACTEDPGDFVDQEIEQFKLHTAPQFKRSIPDHEINRKYPGGSEDSGISISYISCQVVSGDPSLQVR